MDKSNLPAASSVKSSNKEPTEFTMPLRNRGDAGSSDNFENERLLNRIQRLEEENRALEKENRILDLDLTSSRRETKTAIAERKRADAEFAELLQYESNREAQIAHLQIRSQQDSSTIMLLETKLDKRRDENTKLKEDYDSLTASIEEIHSLLFEKTKTVTQLEKNLANLRTDLQVYEYFTRIGVSLRHRTLELEHMPSKQNQSVIDEGNKVSCSSACLADAQLYLTQGRDAVPLTQQSHLSILLGEPRRDPHIYKEFYGSSPANVAKFADVEEFVQMVDYRGAMFKFLGQPWYAQSKFATLVKEMNELIRGKGKEGMRSVFRSERGEQILTEMGRLYNEATRKHNQMRT